MNDGFVEIWGVSPGDVTEIVRDLGCQGLAVHRDFEFEFRPAWVNYQDGHGAHQRSVRLKFRDAAVATWMSLKFSKNHINTKESS